MAYIKEATHENQGNNDKLHSYNIDKKKIKVHVSYSEIITIKGIILKRLWHLSNPFVLKTVTRRIGKKAFRHAENVRELSADRYICEVLRTNFDKQVKCGYLGIL